MKSFTVEPIAIAAHIPPRLQRKNAGGRNVAVASGPCAIHFLKDRQPLHRTALHAGPATTSFPRPAQSAQLAPPVRTSLIRRAAAILGPAMLIAVGYMDPGNWATDIAAGSSYGFDLLFVVAGASVAAIVLQSLALRVGVASGLDLAQASRERYGRLPGVILWALAEIAIIATDVAEVLGGALAVKLLLGLPLWSGILLTAFDMVLVIGLKGYGIRQVEAIVTALVATIALCFVIEVLIVPPDPRALVAGLVPDATRLAQPGALAIAIGIVGATVMPHNLYLHSSIAKGTGAPATDGAKRRAIRHANWGSAVALFLAMLVNGAILALAASAFHATGLTHVADIADAYHLLSPVAGVKAGALFFGIALLASGQSSTFTGTIAGEVVLDGFMRFKLPSWQRRVITRTLAIIPALVGIAVLGDRGVGSLLVVSQIVLSLQLPFAIWPLIRIASDKRTMGQLTAHPLIIGASWGMFGVITAANVWLLVSLVA